MNEDFKFSDKPIEFTDLSRTVNPETEITLHDAFEAIRKSKIDLVIWQAFIGQGKWFDELLLEELKPVQQDKFVDDIDYLELQYCYYKPDNRGYWMFHGVGYKGVLPQDVIDSGHKFKKDGGTIDDDFVQTYAIELTPINQLRHLKIKINPEVIIENENFSTEKMKMNVTMNLLEFYSQIFYEITF